jgi:CTP:molybdopterin cytidylyltransferase MocA
MMICILLSAGKSERFGSPKALARLSDTTVIEHLQNTLLHSKCGNIIVVLGADAKLIQTHIVIHSRIRVVYNKNHNFGQTSSVQAGLSEAEIISDGFMLLPVDCPLVQASSIDKIIEYFNKHQPDILIPTYQGLKGHPPIFHKRLKPKILELPPDAGLNTLFAGHPPQTMEINDPGIVKSFNTREEFQAL